MKESAKVTTRIMVFLGVGYFGVQFFWAFHTSSMPLFLNNFTDSKFKISLVLSLAGVMSCVVPPIVGYLSDRTFTRFGRRKPYIFLGALGIFLCALGLPHMGAYGVVAVISAVMYFSITLGETPYMSLLPDITPPEQRSTASGYMNLLGNTGLIAYFFISSRIWDNHPNAAFYMVAFVSFGAILLAIMLLREPKASPQMPSQEKLSEKASPLSYLKGLAKETNALKFFTAQALWFLGLAVISSFLTLFAVEELKVSEGNSMLLPMAFSIAATIFVLPLGMLGDRHGRKGILSFMIGFWVVTFLCMGFMKNLTQALIVVGFSGIPFAAAMGVAYAYALDLIPPERTAEFVGFNFISMVAPQVLGPLIGGKLIDTLGYRSIFPAGAIFTLTGFIILQFVRPRQVTEGQKGSGPHS